MLKLLKADGRLGRFYLLAFYEFLEDELKFIKNSCAQEICKLSLNWCWQFSGVELVALGDVRKRLHRPLHNLLSRR